MYVTSVDRENGVVTMDSVKPDVPAPRRTLRECLDDEDARYYFTVGAVGKLSDDMLSVRWLLEDCVEVMHDGLYPRTGLVERVLEARMAHMKFNDERDDDVAALVDQSETRKALEPMTPRSTGDLAIVRLFMGRTADVRACVRHQLQRMMEVKR